MCEFSFDYTFGLLVGTYTSIRLAYRYQKCDTLSEYVKVKVKHNFAVCLFKTKSVKLTFKSTFEIEEVTSCTTDISRKERDT